MPCVRSLVAWTTSGAACEADDRREEREVPEPTRRRRRITISEIAERTRVSKSAVSYALNDRSGVSDATRERIRAVAEELGWYPNHAARSLSAARANACGLALARPARTLAVEPFFMEFIVGVESELSPHSTALTIQLADDVAGELMIFRRWWAERRVDGVAGRRSQARRSADRRAGGAWRRRPRAAQPPTRAEASAQATPDKASRPGPGSATGASVHVAPFHREIAGERINTPTAHAPPAPSLETSSSDDDV